MAQRRKEAQEEMEEEGRAWEESRREEARELARGSLVGMTQTACLRALYALFGAYKACTNPPTRARHYDWP